LDKLTHGPASKEHSGVAYAFKIKQHDGFRTMGDVQWRRGENHRTVTLAG
jgi:hypothetical protein